MQPKTAQTQAAKLPDMLKYLAVSGFFMTMGIGFYLFSVS